MDTTGDAMQVVLISGLSGSGKSVALNVLEDAGFYAVDNLPAGLLLELIDHLRSGGTRRLAVAVDVRSGDHLARLPDQVAVLRRHVEDVRLFFFEARDDILIQRFSETRRRHPLARLVDGEGGPDDGSLEGAIARERELLSETAVLGHRIDTSELHPNTLRSWLKELLDVSPRSGLLLTFQSFGFKYGVPLDADFVFDVRCLPNPYYDRNLRPLTGRDPAVAAFLDAMPEVGEMGEDIRRFIARWLPSFVRDNRSYVTVAIGCTGGKHRSVYLAEWLGRQFAGDWQVQVRHRTPALRGIPDAGQTL